MKTGDKDHKQQNVDDRSFSCGLARILRSIGLGTADDLDARRRITVHITSI
jgi:hypothetical protein